MAQVYVIADDLTGLLDSTAVFAGRGLRTLIARSPERLADLDMQAADVIGVCTSSRHLEPRQAADMICRALDSAPSPLPPVLFKKIDSRLKGNVTAETQALVERTGRTRLLVCPAIPDLGRFTSDGRVIGMGIPDPLPVATFGLGDLAELDVPDALSQEMLEAAAAAALSDPSETLLIGAQGLAKAVAAHLRPSVISQPIGSLSAPLLIAMGSRDPISLAQTCYLQEHSGATVITAPNGRLAAPLSQDDSFFPLVVLMTAGDEPVACGAAAKAFASTISDLVRKRMIRTLFACGGDTADAILENLGVGVLEVLGEVTPGIAVSRVPGKDGLAFVTKSGGFGSEAALSVLVDAAGQVVTTNERIQNVRK